MGTSKIDLSSEQWTRISNAGESGTCWKRDGKVVYVDHTDQETADTLPLSNLNVSVDKAKRVPQDSDKGDVLTLPADNSNDIFYAVILGSTEGSIVVDMV